MLARSFEHWNRNADLEFALVTDHDFALPKDLKNTRRIQLPKGHLPAEYTLKLLLDSLSPFDRTLFVDSDCMCFGDLSFIFKRFDGSPFVAIGSNASEGWLLGDIQKRRELFNLEWLPVFWGGVYYFEKGPESAAIFKRARELAPDYDRLECARLRGRPSDEPLLSLAMAERGLRAVEDDGSIKVDMVYCDAFNCDILTGEHEIGHVSGQKSFPFIVHFHDDFAKRIPYTTEVLALTVKRNLHLPRYVARFVANMTDRMPKETVRRLKNLLRPAYRALFGVRPVVPDGR